MYTVMYTIALLVQQLGGSLWALSPACQEEEEELELEGIELTTVTTTGLDITATELGIVTMALGTITTALGIITTELGTITMVMFL